jgi:molybdopterin/thiamine biosynthesis adenylyltransferase
MLVRSGINQLLLIDGDVFLPANLERHILDWRDVGFRKVNAVKRRLNQIKPGARIIANPFNLNWQRSAKLHATLFDELAGCDLIVDATGDTPTSLLLGSVAFENKKPFVSVAVFEGGLGALIARSVPGLDPTYVTGYAAYNAFCDEKNVAPPKSGSRAYEMINETEEPVVADDVAATIAASHASRVILNILDNTVGPQDRGWVLVGFRRGWLFSGHCHTISLDISPTTSHPESVDDEESRMFALALAKEALDAIASPS